MAITSPAPMATCNKTRCGMVMARVSYLWIHCSRLCEQRQLDREGRPFSFDALEFDVSAMQIHAALNDEQTEARSGSLPHVAAAMERLEQPLLIGIGNAATMIHDLAESIIANTFDDEGHALVRR